MNKVNIEITPYGWEIKAEIDNKVYLETYEKTLLGAKTKDSEFLQIANKDLKLFEAIEDVNMNIYEIMKNLK